MTDPNQPPRNDDLLSQAGEEIKGMAKRGMHHPSTKPVLIGAAAGAAAGWLILGGPLLGGLVGAGAMLYSRLNK